MFQLERSLDVEKEKNTGDNKRSKMSLKAHKQIVAGVKLATGRGGPHSPVKLKVVQRRPSAQTVGSTTTTWRSRLSAPHCVSTQPVFTSGFVFSLSLYSEFKTIVGVRSLTSHNQLLNCFPSDRSGWKRSPRCCRGRRYVRFYADDVVLLLHYCRLILVVMAVYCNLS